MKKLSFFVTVFTLLLLFFVFEELQSIRSMKIQSWTESGEADCGVVLTGGSNRIQEGMSLLQQKRLKKLLISGVNPHSGLSQIFPALPFYGAVDKKDIILEKKSKTTYGNAQQSVPILEALNCQSVLLITSRIHMHRAFHVFRKHLSNEIDLYPRAIYSRKEETLQVIGPEVIKSLFYRFWAY